MLIDESITVFELKVLPGSEIILQKSLVLVSEEKPLCFAVRLRMLPKCDVVQAHVSMQFVLISVCVFFPIVNCREMQVTFDKAKSQRMDYMRCKDCKLNWICKSCASACHQGSVYMIII